MLNFLFTKTPLFFFVQSFWRDEAFTYILAKKNIFDLLLFTAKDFNPPLYYLIIHYWIKIFGSSEISIRTVSLIFYWLTIYCVYLFFKNILKINPKRIWIYLLFVSINPIIIYYAFEARMYTMFAFFATLSFYSFFRKNYKLFILSSTFGLYTHYFMIFVLFSQLILAVKNKIKFNFLPFFLFLPWMFFVLYIKDFSSQSFWIERINLSALIYLLGSLFTGYDRGLQFYHFQITVVSLVLIFFIAGSLIYLRKIIKINNKLLSGLIIWSIGIPFFIVLISFFKPVYFPRYLIFSSVGLIILIIYILEHLPAFIRTIILLVFFIIAVNFNINQIEHRKKSNLKKIFSEIKHLASNKDVVYLTSELDYFTAQYYFDENRVYIYGKNYEEIPDYVGKVLIPKSKIVNNLPIYPKKAFVLTSDSSFEILSSK